MKNSTNNQYRIAGFTLIELMVTISIIGVLMAIGVVSYTHANRNARNARRAADIEQVRSALEMYRNDHPQYPAGNNWTNLINTLNDGGYLGGSTQIEDPREGVYSYTYNNPPPTAPAPGSNCRAYSLCYTFEEPSNETEVRCVCNP